MRVNWLIPYVKNARTHRDEQIAQIAASIAGSGFIDPVLIGDHGVVIAGNDRLLAAQRLGMTEHHGVLSWWSGCALCEPQTFYPDCATTYVSDIDVTERPIRIFGGAKRTAPFAARSPSRVGHLIATAPA